MGTRVRNGTLLSGLLACLVSPSFGQEPRLEDLIKIEFPRDGYRFTVAEAAKGIKITYKIVVEKDVENLIPLPFGPSFNEPPGPSGLHPREKISGNGQLYALLDSGLAPPPKGKARTLKKGTYTHAFAWDGRNWTGPSDFGNPRGKPFPPGTYEVIVEMHGQRITDKGMTPYEIRARTKLVLE